mmetsp:Transcript_1380/g.1824  ORF Transcript_1380/g.1824 Transcript_1380/m.1824 type:complete len:97 (+) Transcript_1380:117-407(+)
MSTYAEDREELYISGPRKPATIEYLKTALGADYDIIKKEKLCHVSFADTLYDNVEITSDPTQREYLTKQLLEENFFDTEELPVEEFDLQYKEVEVA